MNRTISSGGKGPRRNKGLVVHFTAEEIDNINLAASLKMCERRDFIQRYAALVAAKMIEAAKSGSTLVIGIVDDPKQGGAA